MITTLLWKDLRRLRANWVGFVVLLAMPLCITALVGTVFGPSARNDEVPRIKLAVVDEDDGLLGGLLVSLASGGRADQFLDTVVTDRNEAMRLVNDNQVSAVIIVPPRFTEAYLAGESTPHIELIKNPAQSFMPAIAEELVRVLTETLNAAAANLSDELPEVAAILNQSGTPDMTRMAKVMTRLGDKFELAEGYVFPPIIGYSQSTLDTQETSDESAGGFNVFAFVMPGLVAMFLLFTAESASKDLIVERRTKTLMRFRTVRTGLLSFFVAKSIYAILVVLLAAAIMLVGGGWIFGITWKSPLETAVLTIGYAGFATGFALLMIAAIYREQLISILSTVIIMLIAFFGGSMLPSEALPPFIRDSLAPWMPNHVFAEAIKRLQFDRPGPEWFAASVGLSITGLVMTGIAILLFQRRLRQGAAE